MNWTTYTVKLCTRTGITIFGLGLWWSLNIEHIYVFSLVWAWVNLVVFRETLGSGALPPAAGGTRRRRTIRLLGQKLLIKWPQITKNAENIY